MICACHVSGERRAPQRRVERTNCIWCRRTTSAHGGTSRWFRSDPWSSWLHLLAHRGPRHLDGWV